MPVTAESFLVSYSQFTGTPEEQIEPAIAKAMLRAGQNFGAARDAAVEMLTAHYLALDPRNENTAQIKGMPGTTFYEQEFEKLLTSFRAFGTAAADDVG